MGHLMPAMASTAFPIEWPRHFHNPLALLGRWRSLPRGGDLYCPCQSLGSTGAPAILKVTPGGALTTFAGTGTFGYSNDGVPAVTAQLDQPSGLTVDPGGTVYFNEFYTGLIRSVGSDGILHSVAGSNDFDETFCGDGGPALGSHLNRPLDEIDATGHLFMADTGNHRIREVLVNAPGFSVDTTSPQAF